MLAGASLDGNTYFKLYYQVLASESATGALIRFVHGTVKLNYIVHPSSDVVNCEVAIWSRSPGPLVRRGL